MVVVRATVAGRLISWEENKERTCHCNRQDWFGTIGNQRGERAFFPFLLNWCSFCLSSSLHWCIITEEECDRITTFSRSAGFPFWEHNLFVHAILTSTEWAETLGQRRTLLWGIARECLWFPVISMLTVTVTDQTLRRWPRCQAVGVSTLLIYMQTLHCPLLTRRVIKGNQFRNQDYVLWYSDNSVNSSSNTKHVSLHVMQSVYDAITM